jgi:hypothetical protein
VYIKNNFHPFLFSQERIVISGYLFSNFAEIHAEKLFCGTYFLEMADEQLSQWAASL